MLWHRKENKGKNKLEQLYEKYNKAMLTIAKEILSDKHLAEDAVHETFARLLASNCEIVEDGREKAYLITACRNVCYDVQKKKSKLKDTEAFPDMSITEQAYDAPQDIVLCDELRAAMVNAINNLDEIYRDVLRMKMVLNMSNKQIAEICGISEGNVRQRLLRAKRQVAEALEKEGLINAKSKK